MLMRLGWALDDLLHACHIHWDWYCDLVERRALR